MRDDWLEIAEDNNLCSHKCVEALRGGHPRLISFREEEFDLPEDWLSEEPGVANRIAVEINDCLPTGLPASFHKAVTVAIRELASFVDMIEKNGVWTTRPDLSESELQARLREHLLSREAAVTEGSKLGGGETDLILDDRIVVENKVRREKTRDPFDVGSRYTWQSRRYSISVCSRIAFVIIAYRPSDEKAVLPLPSRIRARGVPEAREDRCEVRVVIPWGAGVPSSAKRPAKDSGSS